jgi:ssRNA-specific RNase YbeY (16S rRNA maturation enzyme)
MFAPLAVLSFNVTQSATLQSLKGFDNGNYSKKQTMLAPLIICPDAVNGKYREHGKRIVQRACLAECA